MADSSIEWTDSVLNPVVGCSRVSAGCQNCYAERVAHRGMSPAHKGLTVLGEKGPRWTGEVRFIESALEKLYRWQKPRRIFVNSMSDLFHEGVTDEQIDRVFVAMQASPQHTFQVLTKRPERMRAYLNAAPERIARAAEALAARMGWCHAHADAEWPLLNVWIGVSVEDQKSADERIPILVGTPAHVRWVSYEPALGPVNFCAVPDSATRPAEYHPRNSPLGDLDWLVVGGESGPGARPFDLAWARSTVQLCAYAGVPVFVKQLGARPCSSDLRDVPLERLGDEEFVDVPGIGERWTCRFADRKGGDMVEWPEDLRVREFPTKGGES